DRSPNCSPDDDVLMQLNSPEEGAPGHGCELLGSGVLSKIPRSKWDWALERHYARGVWYRCPSQMLSGLGSTPVRSTTVMRFERWEKPPPLGTSGEQFLALARAASPPPPGVDFNHW